MAIEMNPALARGAAQMDFQQGCSLGDNPYPVCSEAYIEWEAEMRRLLDEEDRADSDRDCYESFYAEEEYFAAR